jgi:phosphoadenosine phosphosulfate reductase
MYEVQWDADTGGLLLTDPANDGINSELRPVFHEELSLLGFDKVWQYPKSEQPLLWALGRRYFHKGEIVAEAKGGGFFEAPQLVFHKKDLRLEPVDVSKMIRKNAPCLRDLAQEAIEFIRETQDRERHAVDVAAVAFSGGKDSFAVLDLVQRALRPDEFVVVFNDTGMEITPTLEAVEAAKHRWSNLKFYTSKPYTSALQTWQDFGPPSRLHRWCCSVHKSAPNLLLLRKVTRTPTVRALIYEGVRRNESEARTRYPRIVMGKKHGLQTNARAILHWSAAEVYLYMLARRLPINSGYRYGLPRVGCSVCPLASKWSNAICWLAFEQDCRPLIEILLQHSGSDNQTKLDEKKEFVSSRAWRHRAGGVTLNRRTKVVEKTGDKRLSYVVHGSKQEWLEWAKVLGRITMTSENAGVISLNGTTISYDADVTGDYFEVTMFSQKKIDRYQASCLRAITYKTAYCVRCRTCEVECPVGALTVEKRIQIDTKECIHCHKCITFQEKGCLAAKSLQIGEGGKGVKGVDRYHSFGMRKEWLTGYFRDPSSWWRSNNLGNKQFEAMRVWLKESEIISANEISGLGKRLQALGSENPITWSVIWTHLAKNSALVKWYLENVGWTHRISRGELIDLLPSSISQRTRENGIKTLLSLLRDTPFGPDLMLGRVEKGERGSVYVSKIGVGLDTPSIAVLYSLYRYAENIDRYDLSLHELYNGADDGPYFLFGIEEGPLKKILTGLASRFPKYLSVEFIRDLDNIYIFREHSPLEVINGCTET